MATPYVKQTWVDGDTSKPFSAARLGVIETGIFDAHYRPSVGVHRSGVQAITTSTLTTITWDVEEYDTDAMHSTVSNTGRLVAPVAGKYDITGRAMFATNATGFRQAQIRVNGTTVIDTDTDYGPTAAGPCYLDLGRDWVLAASDYIEMLVSQSSGGNLNVGGGLDLLHLEMHLASY